MNGLSRLFESDLLLNGNYKVEADCDSELKLMLWKKECCREKIETIGKKDGETGNTWNFHIENETVVGIGLLSSDSAILRNFVFERLSNF